MISSVNFGREIRKNIKACLSTFFNGSVWSFGQPVIFPDCDIAFDRPQFGAALKKPVIYCENFQDRTLFRKATKQGMTQIFEIPFRFIVFTNEPGKIWDKNSKIQDCLGVILNGGTPYLDADMKVSRVLSAIPLALDASQEFQVSQRMVMMKIKVDFSVMQDGIAYAFVTGGVL